MTIDHVGVRVQGYVCENGACLSGCRAAGDCGMDKACFSGRCQDPCSQETSPCGTNALCRVSEHRPVCLCPEGYQVQEWLGLRS